MYLATSLLQLLPFISLLAPAYASPYYMSLAGLSEKELGKILPSLASKDPAKPPGPLKFNGTKLVNDKDHPWKPLKEGDIRGPCPGLNTLASHGYLPRNGVASPAQIIQAVMEGFNMDSDTAALTTYAAHLVNGNLVTDLMSIGGKTKLTGPDPPKPATVGGLNTHAVFEGDASLTRADEFFGDNHSFNQTLFDQFVDFSKRFGNGFYDKKAASELRFARVQESIATNPQFDFTSPRFFTAYAESTFPFVFFVDGRNPNRALSMENATLFFRDNKFPKDFFRAAEPTGPTGIDDIYAEHPVEAGRNVNGINSYQADPNSADFSDLCQLYTSFVGLVKSLYPNPKGVLKRNLIINLGFFYNSFNVANGCIEEFPYGKL